MPQELPAGASLNDISAHYNELTIPRELQTAHPLPAEHLARVVVESGSLQLVIGESGQAVTVTPAEAALIPPGSQFRVSTRAGTAVRFYLEYYHLPRLEDGAELAGQLR